MRRQPGVRGRPSGRKSGRDRTPESVDLLQARPEPLRRGLDLPRFVPHHDGMVEQRENRGITRPHHGHQQFPSGERLARSGKIAPGDVGLAHQLAQFGQQAARLLIFGERQQRAVLDFEHRALRFHLEPAHGFHLVAKQVDAHRLAGFRREHVQDAAAQRVFAHHLHRLAPFIPDALTRWAITSSKGKSSPTFNLRASCR